VKDDPRREFVRIRGTIVSFENGITVKADKTERFKL
jgi:hypothetical protein